MCEIVQNEQYRHENDVNDVGLVSLLIILDRFHISHFCSFDRWFLASKWWLGSESVTAIKCDMKKGWSTIELDIIQRVY